MKNESRQHLHLTFNHPHTPKEVKIGYCLDRVEQYVPAPLRCLKCQKYVHHREAYIWRQTCAKYGENDSNHFEEDFLKEIRCANCRQDQPAYARSYDVYKKKWKFFMWNTRGMCHFWKQGKLWGSTREKTSTPLLYGGQTQPIKKTNIEHSWRNQSSWKRMIRQSSRSTWKTTLNWILPTASAETCWEWGEMQCWSSNMKDLL